MAQVKTFPSGPLIGFVVFCKHPIAPHPKKKTRRLPGTLILAAAAAADAQLFANTPGRLKLSNRVLFACCFWAAAFLILFFFYRFCRFDRAREMTSRAFCAPLGCADALPGRRYLILRNAGSYARNRKHRHQHQDSSVSLVS